MVTEPGVVTICCCETGEVCGALDGDGGGGTKLAADRGAASLVEADAAKAVVAELAGALVAAADG